MKIECPHCSQEFDREAVATLADDNRLSISVAGESDLLGADTIGELMTHTAKTLKAIAEDLGHKCEVFLLSASVAPKNVTFEVAVVPVRPPPSTQNQMELPL